MIYSHPNQDMLSFQDKLCENLNNVENRKLIHIVNGDINTPEKASPKLQSCTFVILVFLHAVYDLSPVYSEVIDIYFVYGCTAYNLAWPLSPCDLP